MIIKDAINDNIEAAEVSIPDIFGEDVFSLLPLSINPILTDYNLYYEM